ncbi:hypothetical protein TNIN_399091 [Trichonephila inaurata madagascariensis]|uniref:Uncharacterized protein n=1 Tax=Trichonephila inaurata madagascariensis TaxID=2747483 RepID=A0A8X7CNZ9_9ARAC|nr:hypothetical protein TNIN_399091 [Trichonephila inaurata madagascariensis]
MGFRFVNEDKFWELEKYLRVFLHVLESVLASYFMLGRVNNSSRSESRSAGYFKTGQLLSISLTSGRKDLSRLIRYKSQLSSLTMKLQLICVASI